MSFPKYPKYKDSGVEWLGEVPEHWTPTKLKHLGSAQIGLTYDPSELCGEHEGTLVLRSSNVQEGRIVFNDNVYVNKAIPPHLRTKQGDILICSRNGSRALIGKNAMIDQTAEHLSFGAFMTIFRSNLNRFLYWVFNSQLFELQSSSFLTSTINQLTIGNLNSFDVLLPPVSEQSLIADFLDRETVKIDALVTEQRRLIELLKEKRQAVISHAVTKGLNPAAPMKDSGIEWLGEVPAHWTITRLGFHCNRIGSGKTPNGGSESYLSSGVLFIRSQNVYDDGLRLEDVAFISEEVHAEMHISRVCPGDILLNITGASLGRTCLVPDVISDANVNQHVCVIRLPDHDMRQFVSIVLKAACMKSQFDFAQNGAAREGLNYQQISKLIIPLPPANERADIGNFVEKKCSIFDDLTAQAEHAINLLQERRTALISAAVTGKIDVRQAVDIKAAS